MSASLLSCRFSPLKVIRSAVTVALRASNRMIESAVTDFPEPDSPTMPSVSPASSPKESPLTAVTGPSSVRNVVRRLPTSRSRTTCSGPGLDARQGGQERRNYKAHGGDTGPALQLLLGAEPPAIRGLDAAADGAGKAFLFGRLK